MSKLDTLWSADRNEHLLEENLKRGDFTDERSNSAISPLDFVPEYVRICKSYGILPHPAIANVVITPSETSGSEPEPAPSPTASGNAVGVDGAAETATSQTQVSNQAATPGYTSGALTVPGAALSCSGDDTYTAIDTLTIQHWKVDFGTMYALESMAHTRSLTTVVLTDCGLSAKSIQTLGQLLEDSFIQRLTLEFNPLTLDRVTGARRPPRLGYTSDQPTGDATTSANCALNSLKGEAGSATSEAEDEECPFAWLIPVVAVAGTTQPDKHDTSTSSSNPNSSPAGSSAANSSGNPSSVSGASSGSGASQAGDVGTDAQVEGVTASNAAATSTTSSLSATLPSGATSSAAAATSTSLLQVLSLRGNGLSTRDINRIAARLRKNTTLQSLNLSLNDITDAACADLADAIATNKSLVVLNLSENKISAVGARMLASAAVPCDAERPAELLAGIQPPPSASSTGSSGTAVASTTSLTTPGSTSSTMSAGQSILAKGTSKRDQTTSALLRAARTFRPYSTTLRVLNLAGNPLGSPTESLHAKSGSQGQYWFPSALAACLEAAGRSDVADLLALKYCALTTNADGLFPVNLPLPTSRHLPLNGSYCHDLELPAHIAEALATARDAAWSAASKLVASLSAEPIITAGNDGPLGDMSLTSLMSRLNSIDAAPTTPAVPPALGLNAALGIGVPGLGFTPIPGAGTTVSGTTTNTTTGSASTNTASSSSNTQSGGVNATSVASALAPASVSSSTAAALSAAAAATAAAAAAFATGGASALNPLLFTFPSLTGFSAAGNLLQSAALTGPGATQLAQLMTIAGPLTSGAGSLVAGAGARGKTAMVGPSSTNVRPTTSGSGTTNFASISGSSSGSGMSNSSSSSSGSANTSNANGVQGHVNAAAEAVRYLHSSLVEEVVRRLSESQLIPGPGKAALVNPQLALMLINYAMPHACLAGFRDTDLAPIQALKPKLDRIVLLHTAIPKWARHLIRNVPEIIIEGEPE